MIIECKPITQDNAQVLALPNDPFYEEGRFIPVYDGEKWSYRIEEFPPEKVTVNCFPDEHYKLEEMGDRLHGIAVYADGIPAGFALVYEDWNRWLYLDNLLIAGRYRRQGLGTALIDAAMTVARETDRLGVWLVCQDNNLQAMRFYLKNGFETGGFNLPVYEGTKQAGKADIYLYKRV